LVLVRVGRSEDRERSGTLVDEDAVAVDGERRQLAAAGCDLHGGVAIDAKQASVLFRLCTRLLASRWWKPPGVEDDEGALADEVSDGVLA
jgi:hypothetical protein